MPQKSTVRSAGEERCSTASGLELAHAVVLVDGDRTREQYQEGDRDRRGHRPGVVAEELVPKHPAESRRPHIGLLGPPRSEGMTNSPTAGMKTSIEPAMTPGSESGSVMSKKARRGVLPRSPAASSRIGSSFSRVANSGSTMNG